MMVHPQVGPGADVTMTPFGVFPPQLQPYAQPFDMAGAQADPYNLMNNQQQQYVPPVNKAPHWAVDNPINPVGNDRNMSVTNQGLGSLVDAGLGNQIGGQTQLYWENLIDGGSWRLFGCSALTIQALSQTLLTGSKSISLAKVIEIHYVEHTVHIVFFIIPNECIYCRA